MLEKKGCLIQFAGPVLKELDRFAGQRGLSRNAAVNLACSSLVGEAEQLRQESRELVREAERLRGMIVKIALAKGRFEL